jgi:hypothetical protein
MSQGRIGGEEGRGQSRVEGLGVALTGGGGRRRGLDKIRCGGREEGTVGVQCGRRHTEEGGGEASARSRHAEEDGVAARVRAGDEGGSGWGGCGWAVAMGRTKSNSADF